MADNFLNWMLGDTPALKEISLDEAASRIREAIYKKHGDWRSTPSSFIAGPSDSGVFVHDIYPGYAILSKGNDYFKVSYQVTPEGVEVGDALTPVVRTWQEVV